MGEHFYDQLKDEIYQFSFTQHWMLILAKVLSFCILFALLTILPIFLLQQFTSGDTPQRSLAGIFILVNFGIILFLIHKSFHWFFSYLLSFVIVTNHRIIVIHRSIFVRSEREILDLYQIRDIQMKKNGFFYNIINCGDINLILSAQGKDATVIRGVYNPSLIQDKCNYIRHTKIQERYRDTSKQVPDDIVIETEAKTSKGNPKYMNKPDFTTSKE